MPRTRKNEDQVIRVYRFGARPIGAEVPEELFRQAKAMRTLWNALVERRRKLVEDTAELSGKIAEIRAAKKKKDGPKSNGAGKGELTRLLAERDVFYREFEAEVIAITNAPERKREIGWEAREFIMEKFKTASVKAFRDGADLHFKGGLERIIIPHRFTGGGESISKLFTLPRRANTGRVYMNALPNSVYESYSVEARRSRVTRGRFALSPAEGREREVFDFIANIHRPVPETATVKNVFWCGSYNRWEKLWTWTLQIGVELPQEATLQADELPRAELLLDASDEAVSIKLESDLRPDAGLDVGWRINGKQDDPFLRVGVVVAENGQRFELRLPLEYIDKDMRRLMRLIRRNGGEFDRAKVLLSIFDVWTAMGKLDNKLEETKQKVRKLLDESGCPNDFKQSLARWHAVRSSGLRRLKNIIVSELESEKEPRRKKADQAKSWRAIVELIGEFENESQVAWKLITDAQQRFTNRRNWIYDNIAGWMRRSFRRVSWEGNLNLREMAEKTSPKAEHKEAIENSQKYRQFAGLYELRSSIKRIASLPAQRGWIVNVETADTTGTCEVCDSKCKPSSSLYVTCEKGHRQDQDVRAGTNLLKRLPVIERTGLRMRQDRITIPVEMERFIVEL